MTAQWNAGLLEPISAEAPCGKNLEDSGELALLEAYQIFGQTSLEPPPKEAGEAPRREARKSDRPPNWADLQELSTDCLRKSKDLRALAHLSATVLRTEGVLAFVTTVSVAARWLETYWKEVYPLVDEDAVLRTNALSALADRAAIIDGLRRAPLVSGPLGRFSLRDLDGSQGSTATGEGDEARDDSGLVAAFAAAQIDDLRALRAAALEAAATLRTIDQTMRTQAGVESSPAFDPLVAQLEAMAAALRTRIAEHPSAVAGVDQEAEAGTEGGAAPVGSVRSRQDAIRALDAVADFFRRSEPSSPVPLLVERAKRLVSKNFLEVLADVAPGGLSEAKSAGGIRE